MQSVADANRGWPPAQVVFCDLTGPDLATRLDAFQELPTLRGVRQIVGRDPREDARTGNNALLENPRFATGLREVGERGLTFDLQLIPELMHDTARVLEAAPDTPVAPCHAGSMAWDDVTFQNTVHLELMEKTANAAAARACSTIDHRSQSPDRPPLTFSSSASHGRITHSPEYDVSTVS